MGDYVYATATFGAISPSKAVDVQNVLDAYDFTTLETYARGSVPTTQAVSEQLRLGSLENLHDDLLRVWPEGLWYLSQDGIYEYPGEVISYRKDLGVFRADMDNAGNVVVNYDVLVSTLLTGAGETLERVHQRFGIPWEIAIGFREPDARTIRDRNREEREAIAAVVAAIHKGEADLLAPDEED